MSKDDKTTKTDEEMATKARAVLERKSDRVKGPLHAENVGAFIEVGGYVYRVNGPNDLGRVERWPVGLVPRKAEAAEIEGAIVAMGAR